jgi:hypothetical protein
MEYQFTGEYLLQFPERSRSMVGNLFFGCCRQWLDGEPTPAELVGAVQARTLTLYREGDSRRDVLELVFDSLQSEGAREFAEFVIAREKIPQAERARLKEKLAAEFREQHMASLPVTPRQLSFLRSLGSTETPANRAEASALIDSLLGKRKAA